MAFLLTDGFALMSYASVVEPFRAANVLAGRERYRWTHISVDGAATRASNGASVLADRSVGEALDCDTLFVFAGGDPTRFQHRATWAWLRRVAAGGATVAGISGGPYLMAQAGLLDGYRATIHWEHLPTLVENFPHLTIDPSLYVIDRRRVTCAGGTAGMDLAIELIARDCGQGLAARVGEWFIRTDARDADRPQRLPLRERYGVADDRVLRALALMEASIEEPLARDALAASVGLSVRQLDRLFRTALGTSIAAQFLEIRLASADQLLRRTSMPVTDVAIASGFDNVSYFSRMFRGRYGTTPLQRRAAALTPR